MTHVEAGRRGWQIEDVFFAGVSLLLLLATVGSFVAARHLHLPMERRQYGIEHLPSMFALSCVFTAVVGAARAWVTRTGDRLAWLGRQSNFFHAGLIAVVFAMVWLPVLVTAGFVQDDWLLLAAAVIRKSIVLHPGLSWEALDSMDGNFRPLGTVLYVSYLWKWFGLAPHIFLMGLFVVDLLASLTAFAVVRELGYSKVAGTAAALLFLSRGMIYTIVAWMCALGDGLVILLCGLMALLILKANKQASDGGAVGLHLAAWGCFALATLAKQSSYGAVGIVALLLLLRPGQDAIPPWGRRLATALAALAVYGATAAVTFFHAKELARAQTPYPIKFSAQAVLQTFAYAAWYPVTMEATGKHRMAILLTQLAGVAVIAGLCALMWRVPKLLGARPRDVVFAGLAAVSSLLLFVMLPTRGAPYYGSMAAFWISILLGLMLTRWGVFDRRSVGSRVCCFIFCGLLALGYLDVRLKQTSLVPSGGYTWGTFSTERQMRDYAVLRGILAAHPEARELLITDAPVYVAYYTSMAWMLDPQLDRVLAYSTATGEYLANDHAGERPRDSLAALRDNQAYNYLVPLDAGHARQLLAEEPVLRLRFRNENIEVQDFTEGTVR